MVGIADKAGLIILAITIAGVIGYYNYSQYVIVSQANTIQELNVKSEVTKQAGLVKDVQSKLDTIQEVTNVKQTIKVDINSTTGKHRITFN